jgi:hypothetical protein
VCGNTAMGLWSGGGKGGPGGLKTEISGGETQPDRLRFLLQSSCRHNLGGPGVNQWDGSEPAVLGHMPYSRSWFGKALPGAGAGVDLPSKN